MQWNHTVITLACCAILAACGGGDEPSSRGPQAAELNALAATASALASTTSGRAMPDRRAQAYSADLAGQLFALAEASYPDLLPSKQATRSFDGWSYRFYPETKIYLAVIDAGVYALGGPLGPEVVSLGPITNFVKTTATGKDRPLTAAILAQCPDANASTAPSFYKCMVGNLMGTQTFDASKSCRLDISESGVFTLSSDAKSVIVGPEIGFSIYSKMASISFLSAKVEAPGGAFTNTIKFQYSTGFSFANGGTFDAEATPAGSSTASISCKLTVPK